MAIYINHRIQIKKEAELRVPIGELVEVDGHNISVYVEESAGIVQANGVPQIPMLLFVSNGSGTGWNEDEWRGYQERYLENVENGKLINLDCPHYVHDYEYDTISEEIRVFLTEISN